MPLRRQSLAVLRRRLPISQARHLGEIGGERTVGHVTRTADCSVSSVSHPPPPPRHRPRRAPGGPTGLSRVTPSSSHGKGAEPCGYGSTRTFALATGCAPTTAPTSSSCSRMGSPTSTTTRGSETIPASTGACLPYRRATTAPWSMQQRTARVSASSSKTTRRACDGGADHAGDRRRLGHLAGAGPVHS